MVVEDDESIRLSIDNVLVKTGYETDLAANGVEALKILSENEDLPDLILLDLMMPEMNGFEFLVSFRESIPSLFSFSAHWRGLEGSRKGISLIVSDPSFEQIRVFK